MRALMSRMTASLYFVVALFLLCVGGAAASGVALYLQAQSRIRITAEAISGGHVDAGEVAIGRYGCGSCHEIPGIAGATGKVGPALGGIATRVEIAGMLANDPANMVAWLRHPQRILPGSGMPEMGVTEHDARDVAAYLYTLKR
jgi:cytochrome c2